MWNFCVDTANVYNSIAQTSNVAPHWYGSPIINVINPVAQGTYDAGTQVLGLAQQNQFGYSVSVTSDGTAYIVGAPNGPSSASATNTTSGGARVYRYTNGAWDSGTYLIPASEPANGALYGNAVSISPDGTWAAVGAPNVANGAGGVYIFKYINNSWVFIFKHPGSAASAKFGTSVAITSSGIFAAGAPGAGTSNTGEVLVHSVNPNTQALAQLGSTRTGGAIQDFFGTSVALDATGTILAVGATRPSGQGYVNVYRFYQAGWTADTTTAVVGVSTDLFGTSVSLNAAGNVLAVGAPGTSSIAGSVKTFTSSGTTWTLKTPTITAPTVSDTFGTSVSLNPDGTSLAIGSPSGGYVRVYQSTSAGVFPAYASSKYGYSDITSSSNFGLSVAISQRLVIGAPFLNNLNGNYLKIYTPVSYAAKTWIEEGGETSATTAGPLSSLNISLNGQSRFFPQSGKYFNQYQPWQYHSGSPYPGIYSYSFALKPELNQPSGTCNFSRIDNSQINTILKSAMYTPCNLKLFAVNYNILRITAGMAGVAFSN